MFDCVFSILIPVYNADKYLERCLTSVVNQTFNRFEIICINDGSTDSSMDILEKYKEKDNRIKIIHIENHGIAYARNLALYYASGEYIYFVDSDDRLELNLLEVIYNKWIKEAPDIILFDIYRNIGDKEIYTSAYPMNAGGKIDINNSNKGFASFFLDNYRTVWNKIISKKLLVENNIQFIDLFHADDVLFCLEIGAVAKKVIYEPFAGYHYYFNATSISQKYVDNKVIDMVEKLYFEEIKLECKYKNIDFHKFINTSLINGIVLIAERYVYNPQNKMAIIEKLGRMKCLINKEPYCMALLYYDRKYLSKSAKMFIVKNKANIYVLFLICIIK